jgi:hypothetical protein
MSNKFKPIKIKGPNQGYCQICLERGFLTYDHVPPQGAATLTSVEIRTLSQSFGGITGKPAHSQNGVKFRTICDHCNNVKLGATHDPHLIDFCNELSIFLRAVVNSRLFVGHKRPFAVMPQRIAKAIVGHLLAGCIPEDYEQAPITAPVPDALRNYFLNENEPFPENIDIYYWLYPSKLQVIVNYFTSSDIRYKGFFMASVLKFFPLAFLLVFDKPKFAIIPHHCLLQNKNIGIDDVSSLIIDFDNIPPLNWPEAPGDHNIVMFNDSITLVARDKPKRKR